MPSRLAFTVGLPHLPLRVGQPSPSTKLSNCAALLPYARQPWFPKPVLLVRGRMIASHLLAYFFTELNHDQVQKVSEPGSLTKLNGSQPFLQGPGWNSP